MSVCVCVFLWGKTDTIKQKFLPSRTTLFYCAITNKKQTSTLRLVSPHILLSSNNLPVLRFKVWQPLLVTVGMCFYCLNKPTVKESCGHHSVSTVNQCIYSSVSCCNSSLAHHKQPVCVKGTGGLCFNNSINCKSKSHLVQPHYAARWLRYSVSPIIKHATPYSVLCV